MKALIYDTETNGLPLWRDPSDLPEQPHIVQLAAALVDLETRKVMSSMDVIVRPDGWEIPGELSAIHGITNPIASEWGILEETALAVFLSLWYRSDVRIAYNEKFDARIIRIAMKRHMNDAPVDLHEKWKTGNAECAMLLARPMVGGSKFPTLQESYKHFYGVPFTGAHSAMADVQACAAIYYAIQGVNNVQA